MADTRRRHILNTHRSARRPAHAPRVRHARAFTLLELMAALGLGLMVMAALYHVMFQTIFAAAEGEKVVAQAQLTRAVLNLMAGDLRAALPGGGTEQAHFSGTTDRVTVCTARAQRLGTRKGDTGATLSDVVRVTYAMRGGGEGASGATLVREQRPAVDLSDVRSIMDDPDTQARAAPASRVLASRLAAMHLRYSDGGAWQDEWDSRSQGAPPRAVEISLVFMEAVDRDEDELLADSVLASEEAARRYRLVVFVPTGGKPEEVTSLFRRRESTTERAIRRAFRDTWQEKTAGMDRRLRRRMDFSARASTGGAGPTRQVQSGSAPARKTRAGAWGLRPMD